MLSALVRFGIAVLGTDGKDKTWEILQLFKRDRARAETTHEDELNYRKQVEKYAKDGDIYKITYNKPQSRAYIQIFKRGEPTFDNDELTEEARWAYYISSWQIVDPTEGVPTPHKSFYKRNIPKEANELPDKDNDDTDPKAHDGEARLDSVKSSENLEMKISVQQYKLLFTRKTEEWLYQSQRTRSGGRDGLTEAETASEQASGTFLESYVMNTPSMKDLSKDEVERINGDYRTLQDQGVQDTAATTQGDKEMVDA
ncbi:Transcriptional regulatory protein sin3 [Cryomyces antarcticus]|uniref:Transcriptional regulatory protein sin3 n=1 Tax=Cryomyces antarcticus TaxID=329879 RepID=A0ABR0LWE3_9PEZI|nr:Transcriptional regulatory protein sin3 [Cryomyces antarcticus]